MVQDQNERNKFYHILRRRIFSWIIIVAFWPMILVIIILSAQFYFSYQEKVNAHLGELVQKHKQNIDTFLTEKLGNIRFLVANCNISSLKDERFLQERLRELQDEYGSVFTDLGLINSNGIQVAYTGPFKLERADYADAEWFKKSLASKYYVSDVFLGLRGHPHFIVAVQKKVNDELWILRATIDFGAFNSLVENIRIGETGFAFILNKNEAYQTKPRFDIPPGTISYLLQDSTRNKSEIHFAEKEDSSGKKYIYATSFLKNEAWLLVFQQDYADAFADIRRTIYIAIIIFLLGGGSIVTLAFVMPKRIIKLIATADEKSEIMNQQVIETGKLASIGELAAGIAHEINNPVAIMVEEAGWIGDLLEEEEFKESENLNEFKRALQQIDTQGKRCKQITHKLLSFARKTDSVIKDVQINDLITEIVGLSAQMAKYSNVTIITNLQKSLPFIQISPAEMQQVILNLINNAIDAMGKKGGTITIASKLSQLEKDHIVITVEDNGPGIPEANLGRIFDPFFTTKPVGKGTGLGLSICYGIIQKMGGKIDVNSSVGVGARFRIWVPFQKLKEKQDNQPDKSSSTSGHPA